MPTSSLIFIGLMSGTSLDGVDGVVADFSSTGARAMGKFLASATIPFPAALRTELMALQSSGPDEIHREALVANQLVQHYAQCVAQLLSRAGLAAHDVRAIGVHGQTLRHRPELGYTRQANNPALLAELTNIDVIADFRQRDVAASGQGAPLVPAFHRAMFAVDNETRVVANIGGISNISILPCCDPARVAGFDTGPGNMLMDAWIAAHCGEPYDDAGAWAARGQIDAALLAALRGDAFFTLPPPKSTGRDLFDWVWLQDKLASFSQCAPVDVQATLSAFTATTLADAIARYAPQVNAVYVCGGGAYNTHLMQQLAQALASHRLTATLQSTQALDIAPTHVESLAFAWLADRFTSRQPGNVPAVTGARGYRVLGALYPAS